MSPGAKDSKEDIRKIVEEGPRNSAVVIERLEQLVKKGVITGYDLAYTPVVSGNRTVPRIIWTVERLLQRDTSRAWRKPSRGSATAWEKGWARRLAAKSGGNNCLLSWFSILPIGLVKPQDRASDRGETN